MSLFGALERTVIRFYPYRVPIALLALTLVALGIVVVWRRGWHRPVIRLVAAHRLVSTIAAVAFIAAAIPLGNYLVLPIWTSTTLHEASPLASPGPASTSVAGTLSPSGTAPPTAARVVARGMFSGADDFHFGRGDALLIETASKRHTLRFEQFSVRNGPDLYVYLSDNAQGRGATVLNLGRLRATDGAFNYDLPEGTDIAPFRSAIVWCEQFGVLFATAPFQ